MIHRDECAAQPYEMKLGRRIHVDTMSTPPRGSSTAWAQT